MITSYPADLQQYHIIRNLPNPLNLLNLLNLFDLC
jgi:hypothetical protein